MYPINDYFLQRCSSLDGDADRGRLISLCVLNQSPSRPLPCQMSVPKYGDTGTSNPNMEKVVLGRWHKDG